MLLAGILVLLRELRWSQLKKQHPENFTLECRHLGLACYSSLLQETIHIRNTKKVTSNHELQTNYGTHRHTLKLVLHGVVSSTFQIVQKLVHSYFDLVRWILALEATELVSELVTQMAVELINIHLISVQQTK